MKRIFGLFLFVLALGMVFQILSLAAMAQAGAGPTTDTAPLIPPAAAAAFAALLDVLLFKHGAIAAIAAWQGVLRWLFKPGSGFVEQLVRNSPTQLDDRLLARAEASKLWRAITWLIDFATSVKLGPQRPI